MSAMPDWAIVAGKDYPPEDYAQESVDSAIASALLLPWLIERYGPRSLLDVGCGVGQWCRRAHDEFGLSTAVGIDGPWTPFCTMYRDGLIFITADLEQLLPVVGRFDVALCIEVAEHLSSERGPSLVAELCRLAPLIAWSAAPPGQGGAHHVNERPREYWSGLFQEHGYRENIDFRQFVAAQTRLAPWLRDNITGFVRDHA